MGLRRTVWSVSDGFSTTATFRSIPRKRRVRVVDTVPFPSRGADAPAFAERGHVRERGLVDREARRSRGRRRRRSPAGRAGGRRRSRAPRRPRSDREVSVTSSKDPRRYWSSAEPPPISRVDPPGHAGREALASRTARSASRRRCGTRGRRSRTRSRPAPRGRAARSGPRRGHASPASDGARPPARGSGGSPDRPAHLPTRTAATSLRDASEPAGVGPGRAVGHMRSGAETPSSARPFRSTCATASFSTRRVRCTSSTGSPATGITRQLSYQRW